MGTKSHQAAGTSARRRKAGRSVDLPGDHQDLLAPGAGAEARTRGSSGGGSTGPADAGVPASSRAEEEVSHEEVRAAYARRLQEEVASGARAGLDAQARAEAEGRWRRLLESAGKLSRVEALAQQVEQLLGRANEMLSNPDASVQDLKAAAQLAKTACGIIGALRDEIGDLDPTAQAIPAQSDPVMLLLEELRQVRCNAQRPGGSDDR